MRIFINYRRSDVYVVDRIDEALAREFGRRNVFRDVERIEKGKDFRRQLDDAIAKCDATLVVIGPDWLSAKDESGKPRLDDPNDWVRIEIEAALARDIPTIPLLVGLSEMPSAEELPRAVRNLAYRQGMPIRHARDFQHDIDELIAVLKGPRPRAGRPRTLATISGALVLAIALASFYMYNHRHVARDVAAGPSTVTRRVPDQPAAGPLADTSANAPAEPTTSIHSQQPVGDSSEASIHSKPPVGDLAGPYPLKNSKQPVVLDPAEQIEVRASKDPKICDYFRGRPRHLHTLWIEAPPEVKPQIRKVVYHWVPGYGFDEDPEVYDRETNFQTSYRGLGAVDKLMDIEIHLEDGQVVHKNFNVFRYLFPDAK
jgi:hypothetical protein